MLSISIVIYRLEKTVLEKSLQSLILAINKLSFDKSLLSITLIDNGNQRQRLKEITALFENRLPAIKIISGLKNIGYGRAHNLAILTSDCRYHLILNPDVILHENSLKEGLEYLESKPGVCGVAPFATDKNGYIQYLCKKYPAVFDLLLRGFAPEFVKALFKNRLNAYEMRAIVEADQPAPVELISGCFMLCKTRSLKEAGGFDEQYFLYFEDFALSMELNKLGSLHYVPNMRIIHYGGYAAHKGLKHIAMFIRSGVTFFNNYGWKIS